MQLEKGDVIYEIYYGNVFRRHIIHSVTKTLAKSEILTFKRNYNNGIRLKSGYSPYVFKKETEELKTQFEIKKMLKVINNTDFSELSENDIKKIYTIIDGYEF